MPNKIHDTFTDLASLLRRKLYAGGKGLSGTRLSEDPV